MALGVKDWDRHQHFTRRRPTWIKLWHGLLNDRRYGKLPRVSQALLPMLWILASEFDHGVIDLDDTEIAFRVRWPESEFSDAIKPCINAGFIITGARSADVLRKLSVLSVTRQEMAKKDATYREPEDLLSKLSPSDETIIPRNQNNLKQLKSIGTTSDSESESESEAERESIRESLTDRYTVISSKTTKRPKAVPKIVPAMVAAYNEAVAEFEVNWPKCQSMTPKRSRLLVDISKHELGGLAGWSAMLQRAARSSFLNGTGKRSGDHANWKASIDYFARLDVFVSVLEGKNDDKSESESARSTQGGTSSRARALAALNRRYARG